MKKFRTLLCCLCSLWLFFGIVTVGTASEDMEQPVQGTVTETMNSGGYTYIQVKTAQGEVWAAIPETPMETGREVTLLPGAIMNDFFSKTLNRTFPTIIFTSGLSGPVDNEAKGAKTVEANGAGMSFADALRAEGSGQGSSMHGGSMHGGSMPSLKTPSGGSMGNVVPAAEIKVEKAQGDNGYTVGEIYAKAQELAGKKVKIRAQVVKMSPMIMGKNWLHIQDGTGDALNNTHDLVVTTMASPAKGTVVVVEGELHADRDFGYGYRYDVIVEDAEVVE